MKPRMLISIVILSIAVLSGNAPAQPGIGAPTLRGVFNPVVGAGSAYTVERRRQPTTDLEIAVVGKDVVEDKPGYWLEMSSIDPRSGKPFVLKHLLVRDGDHLDTRKMVMQLGGQPPMEIPPSMIKRSKTGEPADVRKQAELVGTEEVTTPAGTFTCEHYRTRDGSTDIWVSDKVTPWGMVKLTGRDTTITLVRVIADATTHLTGPPQPFDPARMQLKTDGVTQPQ